MVFNSDEILFEYANELIFQDTMNKLKYCQLFQNHEYLKNTIRIMERKSLI